MSVSRPTRFALPLGTVAISLASLLSPVGVARAHATTSTALPLQEREITSTVANVVSSTGKKLAITVGGEFADEGPTFGQSQLLITVESRGGREQHAWHLTVHNQDVAVSATGHGKLLGSSKGLGKWGHVALTLAPRAKAHVVTCGTTGQAEEITQKLTMTGHLYFNTHTSGSKRWGTIGTTHHSLKLSLTGLADSARGTHFDDCISMDGDDAACATSLEWFTQSHDGVAELQGGYTVSKGKKHGYVGGRRTVDLTTPTSSFRVDTVQAPAPVPNFVVAADNSATLTATTHGHGVRGSATIVTNHYYDPPTVSCSNTKHEDQPGWSGQFTNGSKPLVVSEDVFGPMSAPSATYSDIEQTKPVTLF